MHVELVLYLGNCSKDQLLTHLILLHYLCCRGVPIGYSGCWFEVRGLESVIGVYLLEVRGLETKNSFSLQVYFHS